MIFVIAPLVQERQTARQWLIRAVIYAVALVTTVILFNTLLALAAQRVQMTLGAPLWRTSVGEARPGRAAERMERGLCAGWRAGSPLQRQ